MPDAGVAPMSLIALISVLAFAIVGGLVGVRLLLLARRTRKAPELVLGLGLCGVLFVTFPTIVLAVAAGLGPPVVERGLFAAGLLPVAGFVVGLFAFTWIVFRRESRVCRVLVAAAAAVALAVVVGLARAKIAHWEGGALEAVRPWALALVGLFGAALAWTGGESLGYWRRLRRQRALGLADPLVANRFFLWGAGAWIAVAALAVLAGAKAVGLVMVEHPLPRLAIGVAGLGLSVSWYLAFVPPAAYAARLRRGAVAS